MGGERTSDRKRAGLKKGRLGKIIGTLTEAEFIATFRTSRSDMSW